MKLIRRIKTTIVDAIDNVVGSLENHEAILEASLKTAKLNLGKAKARLNYVSSERAKLEENSEKDEAESLAWLERAKTTEDRTKALECLRRHEQLKRKAASGREMSVQQKIHEDRLSREILQVEEKLRLFEQKKNIFKVRAAKAEVFVDSEFSSELDEMFTKWDETLTCLDTAHDSLASEYESKEEEERLSNLLDSIK